MLRIEPGMLVVPGSENLNIPTTRTPVYLNDDINNMEIVGYMQPDGLAFVVSVSGTMALIYVSEGGVFGWVWYGWIREA